MEQLVIKRGKLRKRTLMDHNGCGCFTGFLCLNRGFTIDELIGLCSPAGVARRQGNARGLKGLVNKTTSGFETSSITDRLMAINDGDQEAKEREALLTATAKEIGVLAVFVD